MGGRRPTFKPVCESAPNCRVGRSRGNDLVTRSNRELTWIRLALRWVFIDRREPAHPRGQVKGLCRPIRSSCPLTREIFSLRF
jgi:hypothetical protein